MSTELSKRVATGVVGGAILLALIIWGGWMGIFGLTLFLSMAMLFEYAVIVYALSDRVEKRWALLLVGWFAALATLFAIRAEFEVLILCFLAYFIYFLFTAKRHTGADFKTHFNELAMSL